VNQGSAWRFVRVVRWQFLIKQLRYCKLQSYF
jgi:hypothetical protein